MAKPEEKITMTFRVKKELHRKMREKANKEGRILERMMEEAIEQMLGMKGA